ncbi:type II toxin-antitoxin system RelE/ParE family toxin [Pseudolysobacter antarcticus]|uniref:Type II toxin-antitoxin system RelE/ParE family toxin n=1 Tax=Pseudolysobacter antarcticus TaxID=2511995 RepID=A0A411HHP3_9GAMM|nr:type II toxin-antitoxin system RelE/ParE family toxin [Pseudolysobacter antarcticus]QBB70038.1 type II toxin-antitoxin system RelE/ParE family toxin [Pseudolysobacter antarcticus]
MRYKVLLTAGAERDLETIHDYIAEYDSSAAATRVLDRLEKVVEMLASMPERGSHPRELLALGIHEYRQTVFKPWRVIYRVVGRHVYIFLIADGRRDLHGLLTQRLLGA